MAKGLASASVTVPLCCAPAANPAPRPQDSPGSPAEQLEAYCVELEGTAVWGGQLELGALAQVRGVRAGAGLPCRCLRSWASFTQLYHGGMKASARGLGVHLG